MSTYIGQLEKYIYTVYCIAKYKGRIAWSRGKQEKQALLSKIVFTSNPGGLTNTGVFIRMMGITNDAGNAGS